MEKEPDRSRAFDHALSNFTFGMANRDLICHLADKSYSVKRIKAETDYPVSVEKIAETVWEHYIETGVIRTEAPGKGFGPRYDYVMDIGRYGKRSFRRVEAGPETADAEKGKYIACNFGICKTTDPARYQKMLSVLDSRKRDYIDGLPWPPKTVYHIDNLMIREIRQILTEQDLWP